MLFCIAAQQMNSPEQSRTRLAQYQMKQAASLPFYDDPRLRERHHVRKIEPASQIIKQSLLSFNIQYHTTLKYQETTAPTLTSRSR